MVKKRIVIELNDISAMRIICKDPDCGQVHLWSNSNPPLPQCTNCGAVFFTRYTNRTPDMALGYLCQALTDLRSNPDAFKYNIEFEIDISF